MFWLAAIACEALGKPQRAMRLYARIETIERTTHYQAQRWGDPRPGDAKSARLQLMWNTGDPDTMHEALTEGLSRGDPRDRQWITHTRKAWHDGAGETHIAAIRKGRDTLRRTSLGDDRRSADIARVALAETYLNCRLLHQALTQSWEHAETPDEEWALARIAAETLKAQDAQPEKIRRQWERALAARETDPIATLGVAETYADEDLAQAAGVWAVRAAWRDRGQRSLGAAQLNEAAEIMSDAGRHQSAAQIDRRLLRSHARKLPVMVAIGATERRLERGDPQWIEAMNEALDSIAIERYGTATLALLTAMTLRTRAKDEQGNAESPREGETLRTMVRQRIARHGRYRPIPSCHRTRAIARTLADEPPRLQRLIARMPEPVGHGLRALRAAERIGDTNTGQSALRSAAMRAAALFEEWGLRAPQTGHPSDDRARAEMKRTRTALHVRPESELEWNADAANDAE